MRQLAQIFEILDAALHIRFAGSVEGSSWTCQPEKAICDHACLPAHLFFLPSSSHIFHFIISFQIHHPSCDIIITDLIIPDHIGFPNYCELQKEEKLTDHCQEHNLGIAGWIHVS